VTDNLLFGIEGDDLEVARGQIERRLGIALHPRYSDYRGGDYYHSTDFPRAALESEHLVLRHNFVPFEREWEQPQWKNCTFLLDVCDTERPSFFDAALAGYATRIPASQGGSPHPFEPLAERDLDVPYALPAEYKAIASRGLVDLTPWRLLDGRGAVLLLRDLRRRFRAKYVPFASCETNNDLACFDPAEPGAVVIVHDYTGDGSEREGASHPTFSAWLREATADERAP